LDDAECGPGFQSIAVLLSRFGQRDRFAAQWIALSATRSATLSPDLIDQAGQLLAEAAGAKSEVILFGSHARGEAGPDSDVDFLVIEPAVENRLREWERLRRALRDFPAPVDIVVLDEERAEQRAKVPGTMVHHAFRDGRILAHA
jgi:predicted nucleotidyltransferase